MSEDKSNVGMEHKVCMVCGQQYATGAILLDRRLRASIPRIANTGWGLCEEHMAKYEEGFLALVECDQAKSSGTKPEDVWRTGVVIHMKQEAFDQVFTVPSTGPDGKMLPVVWIGPEMTAELTKMVEPPRG